MVLEEATSSPGSDDNFPSNDDDPYDNQISSVNPSRPFDSYSPSEVDLSQLPKPVPILGPLFGFPKSRIARSVIGTQVLTARMVKRPLTQHEADAIAYGVARTLSISSWGVVLGGAAALARCYQTSPSFKFPMMRRGLIDINFNQFGKWTGARANRGWHIIRGSLYLMFGSIVGHTVFSTYAATTESKRLVQDPKLKDLVATFMQNAKQKTMNAKSSDELFNMSAQKQQASPFGRKADAGFQQSGGMSTPSYPSADYAKQTPYTESTMTSTYDDASPTAGSPPMNNDQVPRKLSSWDRIRKDALSKGNAAKSDGSGNFGDPYSSTERTSRWQSQRGDNAHSDNGYTFSSTEEDRQLAKAQAKKEFEAMLERERRGENP